MRVLLVTHSYWPETTPPQRRWDAFVKAFRRAGCEVDVVAPSPDPAVTPAHAGASPAPRAFGAQEGPHGETVHRLPGLRLNETRLGRLVRHSGTAALTVPRALAAPRPDVVIVTVPSLPNIVAGWMVARLRRRPLVVEMRDAWPDLARESAAAPRRRVRAFEAVMSSLQRRADLVVTVTAGFRDLLVSRGVRRAATIPNGVVPALLPRVPPRAAHGGPLRVLYLGNHGESQGLETVVRAAALARGAVQVRFVGTGTMKPSLRALSERCGAGIEFLDPVHGRGVDEQYAWADTCVVSLRPDWPSFEWTVPSKSYELMSTGRHLTAVLRGEAARLLNESGSADVVAAEPEAIARLWRELSAAPERLTRNSRARDWVTEHASLDNLGREYVRLVAELVEEKTHVHGR
ncbi:glycosyltransferase family 4 protein [Arthrobacter halodurans]|uniref:D-inositol 3-phosphate glycosyltransferase n=1 Tax=Arthrobacter halodurans TaxID=516699 RepID=A0ABV4ULI1_9MICC